MYHNKISILISGLFVFLVFTYGVSWYFSCLFCDKPIRNGMNYSSKKNKSKIYSNIVIVGAGLTGAVLANKFAALNKTVLILEKRNHIAGNCYDYVDEKTKILVNKYGAHLFHTNDEEVWEFLQQFDKWKRWDHEVLAMVNNQYVPVPININSVYQLFSKNIQTLEEMTLFLDSTQIKLDQILNSEDMALSRVGSYMYKTIFEPYTIKQWGKHPSMLDPEVTARIPVRNNFDNRYFTDKYQALPENGYTYMISNMLSSEFIQVYLNTDFFDIQETLEYEHLFFTGPIDRFFKNHGLPNLEYRSIIFEKK